ncbi:MAG: ATP-binding protein [Rickettsiales bacterium]
MESRASRIIKTFTFRLASVYIGLFSVSVVILFAFIYTFAMRYVQSQVSDAVRVQYGYLTNEYQQNGSSGVETRINELINADDNGTEIYLLINNKNEKLAGNLNEWPVGAVVESSFDKNSKWISFRIEGTRQEQPRIQVKAITIPLSKWRSLLVGKTLQNTEKIEQIIIQTFWASLLVTLFMAFIGALVITRSVMNRINIINRSAYNIMHGELSTRIPFTKGGDEFDDLSSNLNNMLDKIENLLKSLGQFANNIAHDLRSPLNRIINRLDAGLRNIDEGNPARNLLEKNITDMHELIGTFNSILKISELEANTEFRDFKPCNLQEIIENMVEFYEPYAAEKDIVIVNNVRDNVTISGEKNLLTQAFTNILDNAIKFTPKGGKIDIYCEQKEDVIDVIIADNGVGIPPDYMDKVFEKFFRLEQSRHTKGNGLGLSLVDAIAGIHNAEVILSDNSPGLRVCLRFNNK